MTTSLIVAGSLNVDIVASGVKQFPGPGQYSYGDELVIGPGGKSHNIADMAARLMKPKAVAMLGHTAKDLHGLWRIPLDALQAAGHKLPPAALIAVDTSGNNQIIVLPGASDDFSPRDIDQADQIWEEVAQNEGYLAITLECPLKTVEYALQKARQMGIKTVFDPGGLSEDSNIRDLLQDLYLMKPNEHEAKMLTGIEITNFDSARQAAAKLIELGVQNILITVGNGGAYLFGPHAQRHIPIRHLPVSRETDETGCGDQTLATLCAYLQAGVPIEEATEIAVLAGTLQFHKRGIQPIMPAELETALKL